jgi:NTE family protein
MNSNLIRTNSKQKTLGLALSGGGARGLAHVGILKVLEQNQIIVSFISGCSMGGLIGAFYALGLSLEEIEKIVLKHTSVREMINIVDRTPRRRGLIVGHRLKSVLAGIIGKDTQFSDTKIPFVVNAVDLISSREVVLSEGNLLDAVMATIAVPGVFAPVNIGNMQLIDGGMLNNLPINNLLAMKPDISLAINVHPDIYHEIPVQFSQSKSRYPFPIPDFLLDLYRAELIMSSRLTELSLEVDQPSLLIQPSLPPEINTFYGYQRAQKIIALGEEAARSHLPQLRKLLAK